MKYLIVVEGDTNDADYISNVGNIAENEIEIIKKVASAIKSYDEEHKYGHNWPMFCDNNDMPAPYEIYKDILTEDDIECMDGYIPYGEYGIHSIKSIRILKVEEDTELL